MLLTQTERLETQQPQGGNQLACTPQACTAITLHVFIHSCTHPSHTPVTCPQADNGKDTVRHTSVPFGDVGIKQKLLSDFYCTQADNGRDTVRHTSVPFGDVGIKQKLLSDFYCTRVHS
ncbi:hypothetical protein P7K49_009040 [Saguinus oedipus]|uniref:Uncharacterized protein n=1 Tax=Saguinus oedipus TaxID=9490 RepID=A0ABQ9W140_SAGOE|nr:hypothetical protein P7K49_009040 [Saguinus oedipus]